ncbi:uncharacterized protein GGS25DRAFT_9576 [Hypoxylon fragiforme]|uniref:uncharacterized protein n=1 Tax=Hypoxylon fragiforme TaxID=63214 RepID=UPI0020C5D932|nr:uncharacterized protein GGS25DRAFT_9576 [Hypoxylon fragiforme]KAI2613653.1 hypothetical protein GGS25DRAFT_9576 [Hypoxylon fragiforme]
MDGTVHNDPDGSGEFIRPGALTRQHIETIVIFERLGAALSVTGILLIFIAYAAFKRLRTVPNTFIVFASCANLGASIACLIGYSGVQAGSNSHLCQAQAFMFELFMQSDPWWSFAMAVNVYMVFFFSADPKSFLQYWWAYCLVCYGVPFIPSLWLLIVRGGDGQNVYGNATIWCWIDKDWSNLRIYTYYLPIWVCIILSSCIYIAVGYYVFKQRNQLRNLSLSNPTYEPPATRDSGEKTLFPNAAVMGRINREVVQITTVNSSTAQAVGEPSSTSGGALPTNWFDGPPDNTPNNHNHTHNHPSQPPTTTTTIPSSTPIRASPNPYQTTITRITADPAPHEGLCARARGNLSRWRSRFAHMDPVKLAYLRTSFVFAISVFVTWTPSSINRVHDLVYAETASFALNLASAVVLPLQGVWNAVIFFSTTWSLLRAEVRACADRRRGLPRGHEQASQMRCERERERDRAVELARRKTGGEGQGEGERVDDADADADAGSDVSVPSTLTGVAPSRGTVRVMRGGSLTSL